MAINSSQYEELECLGINRDGVDDQMPAQPEFQHAIRDVLRSQYVLYFLSAAKKLHM